MKNKTYAWMAVLLLILTLVVPVAAQEGAEPQAGGTLSVALQTSPPSLDMHSNASMATRTIGVHIFEPLVTFGEDFSIVPVLAETWDVSEDGKSYTFNLRQGVKFHNGNEMTSEDVIASIDRFMEVSVRKAAFQLLESWEAPDAYTVVMNLSNPSGSFLDAVASPSGELSIMPKDIVTGKGAGELGIPDEIVGTGPYQLAEFKADQYARLVKFADYQAMEGERDGLGGAKVPYFDEIQFNFVKEVGSRVAGLETGEYDFADAIPYTELDRLTENSEIQTVIVKPSDASYLLFNHDNALSGNVNFRQAVLAALNMEAIGMAITSGQPDLFRLNPTIWPVESTWYFESDQAKELYNQQNIEKAKELLDKAGYAGEEIVLVTNREYDYMYKTIIAVADQLEKQLGMKAKVEIMDWPSMRARWEEDDSWQISVTGYQSPRLLSPDAWATFWASPSSSPERAGYNNPDMDKAFEDLSKATTMEGRKEKVQEIQTIMYETLPHINVVEFFQLQAVRADIEGYKGWYLPRFFGVWREQ